MRTLQNHKGFTLIELIIVIVVIGILAALAIPKYISMTKDADYAAVKGMVGALNGAAAAKFAYNRLCADTGNCTATAITTGALLGAQLDPPYSTTNYPKWTIDSNDFVYTSTSGAGTTWTCTFTAEVATVGSETRARIALPAYAGD